MTRWINRTKCAFLAIILFSSFFLNIFVSSISNAAANKITVNINIKVSDFNSSTTSKKYGPKYLVLRQIEQKSGGSEAQLSSGTNYKSAVIVAGSNKEVVSTSAIAQKTDKTVTLTGEFSNIAQYSGGTSAKYSVCLYTDKNFCSEEKTFYKSSKSSDFYSAYNWNVGAADGNSQFLKASYGANSETIDPDTITAKVSVDFSSSSSVDQTIQSIPIVLKTNTSTATAARTTGNANTIINTVNASAQESTQANKIELLGVFEKVTPITTKNYKVCLKSDNTICAKEELTNEEVFRKVAGQPLTVVMSLTEEQYNKIIGTIGTSDNVSTCSSDIGGIGWILCPVMNFSAKFADAAYGQIEKFLVFKNPTELFDQNNSTFKAWQSMRNIANILFVLAFLIIIYSQMTGFGMTNYGVKKLLPRLVVAAILVNLSFYICQIAVDVTNVLGSSLNNMLSNVISQGSNNVSEQGAVSFGLGAATAAMIGIAAVWTYLPILIPTVLSAVVALFMVLVILVARQAIIILLIVVSPIAFVAYLLPNTNQWFTKWKKIFIGLLIIYPMIGIVFGGSTLISQVLTSSFADGDSNMGLMLGALANTLPLFIVPGMLKKSIDSAGNISGTLKGMGDKWSKSAGSKVSGSRIMKYWQAGRSNNESLTKAGVYNGINPIRRARSGIYNRFNKSPISGKFGDRISAAGIAAADKLDAENVSNAAALLSARSNPERLLGDAKQAFEEAVLAGDSVKARAAQSILLKTPPGKAMLHESYMNSSLSNSLYKKDAQGNYAGSTALLKSLKSDINSAGVKGSDAALSTFAYTDNTLENVQNNKDNYKLNSSDLVGQNEKTLWTMYQNGALTQQHAMDILANQNLTKDLPDSKKQLLEFIKAQDPTKGIASSPKALKDGKSEDIFKTW